jgi:hypothetical protein
MLRERPTKCTLEAQLLFSILSNYKKFEEIILGWDRGEYFRQGFWGVEGGPCRV